MSTQKIIFKVPEFPHLSETFIVAQIVTAINLGYDVRIMTRRVIDNLSPSPLIEEYNLLEKIILEDFNVPTGKIRRALKWLGLLILYIHRLDSLWKFHRHHGKFSFSWLYQWHFFMGFNSASCFHVQYGTNAYPLPLLKSASNFKPSLIVTFHGHDAFFPINGYIPNNGYYDDLFKSSDLITANTLYLRDQLLFLGCPLEKLCTIPVGVDTEYFTSETRGAIKSGQLHLLSVGRLDPVKGHRYCIEVVKKLVGKNLNVVLTIIGEGSERSALERMIADYQLKNNVFLPGSKSPEEVREHYLHSHVYIILAVPVESGRRETQGLATLEAQACGLPVIAFDSGGIKYTIKDKISGYVCDEYDVEDVISKIELLYHHRTMIMEMGRAARDFVKNNYSQAVIDAEWKKAYSQIISYG